MDQIPEMVVVDSSGQEERIFRPGFLNSGRISYSKTHFVWDEFIPDTRWSNRNYSIIRSYDMTTGLVSDLGSRTRYYAPAISSGGNRVAAVEQTDKQVFNLVIVTLDGTIEQVVHSPGNRFIQQPAWMENDTALVVLVTSEAGKSLYRYSLQSGAWREIFNAGLDDISYPVVKGDRIYFSGTFSGIDNIYCYRMDTGDVFQVTSSRFGAFQPQVSGDGKNLFYSDYTSGGYDAVAMKLEDGSWKPLDEIRDHREQVDYKQTPEEEMITGLTFNSDTTGFEPRRYWKGLHLFNIHSWLPLYFDYLNPRLTLDPEQLPVSLGLSLVSQNLLSTAVSQLGYEYRDGFHMLHSGIKFNGRYPVVNLYFDYGGQPDVLRFAEGDSVIDLPRGMGFTAQTYIPFRVNSGKFLSLIQPEIDYHYNRDIAYNDELQRYQQGAHYIYYSLYATSFMRKGMRDILPRVGFKMNAGYYQALFNNPVFGAAAMGELTTYLPGPVKHQTIRLSVSYQKQFPKDMSRPAFINLIGIPRGLHGIFGEEFTRYSADYVFPIVCPDIEIGGLLYVKRIRGAIWADHLKGTNVIIYEPNAHYEDRNYTTCGIELVADMHFLRISFPVSLGGRLTYEPETGRIGIEGIYSINFN